MNNNRSHNNNSVQCTALDGSKDGVVVKVESEAISNSIHAKPFAQLAAAALRMFEAHSTVSLLLYDVHQLHLIHATLIPI